MELKTTRLKNGLAKINYCKTSQVALFSTIWGINPYHLPMSYLCFLAQMSFTFPDTDLIEKYPFNHHWRRSKKISLNKLKMKKLKKKKPVQHNILQNALWRIWNWSSFDTSNPSTLDQKHLTRLALLLIKKTTTFLSVIWLHSMKL